MGDASRLILLIGHLQLLGVHVAGSLGEQQHDQAARLHVVAAVIDEPSAEHRLVSGGRDQATKTGSFRHFTHLRNCA